MTSAGAPQHRDRGLQLIAVFKLVKAALLVLAGVGVLALLRPAMAANVTAWLVELTNSRALRHVQGALAFLRVPPPGRIEEFGAASICYGLLFATEGVGLWMGKRWAEYLTVCTTGGLIPLELYAVSRHLTALRAVMLLANLILVAYLVYRLRHPKT